MNDDKFYSFFKPRIIQLLNLREKNYEENFYYFSNKNFRICEK